MKLAYLISKTALALALFALGPATYAQTISASARPDLTVDGRYYVDIHANFDTIPTLGGGFFITFPEPPLTAVSWVYGPVPGPFLFTISTGSVGTIGFTGGFGGGVGGYSGDVLIGTLTLDATGGAGLVMIDLEKDPAFAFFDYPANSTEIAVVYVDAMIDLSVDRSVLFSLDIGSDNEISDPVGAPVVVERNDPGDVFAASQTAGSLFGGTIFLNDVDYFGTPEPPPVRALLASRCPPGGTMPSDTCFDLDGYDILGSPISALQTGAAPLLRSDIGEIDCLHSATHFALSFNDDPVRGIDHASPPRVATEGVSPAGQTYGTTAARNEVIGMNLTSSYAVSGIFSLLSESELHIDLAPDPDLLKRDDDDVDALDIRELQTCEVHYFSPDDEADAGLRRGSIYEYDPSVGGYLEVVNNSDLGLLAGADIDAFEFAWVSTAIIPDYVGADEEALAVLFSVDPNKPSTILNESGFRDERAIHVSFLDGNNYVLVPPLGDDIDALTISAYDLFVNQQDPDGDGVPNSQDNCTEHSNPAQIDIDADGIGNRCDADFDQTCFVNLADLSELKPHFFSTEDPLYDLDGDGSVNFADLGIFKDFVYGPPGPSGTPNPCD